MLVSPWGAPINDCLLTFAAQGSACIYSRKVEHLYALTYSTLDMLFDRSKKAKVRARERERVGDLVFVLPGGGERNGWKQLALERFPFFFRTRLCAA